MKKTIAVLGIGIFGESVAIELTKAGCEVLAVDNNREHIQSISDQVTHAVIADVCDTETMKTLGISNMDAVVIAITKDLNASILATILAKEAGVPLVVAKSADQIHTKILEKVGADKVIIPEHESGFRIAHQLLSDSIIDLFELSNNSRMLEMQTKSEWTGRSLRELNLRQKYHINVIAIRQKDHMNFHPEPDDLLEEGSSLLVVADTKDLHRFL